MSPQRAQKRAREIDLLALPIRDGTGIAREGGLFRVMQPWALARYGRLQLASGWWRFDAESDDVAAFAEVRLSSARDPLISVPVGGGEARIFLRDDEWRELSLLVAAWPGDYRFSKLRLTHLGPRETIALLAGATRRLAGRKGKRAILAGAIKRLMAGQAVGMSLPARVPRESPPASVRPAGAREVHEGGVRIRLEAGESLHRDALRMTGETFARQPELQVLVSDVIEADVIRPHPAWDPVLAASGVYDAAPLFFRESAGAAGADLAQLAARAGPHAIGRIPLPLVHRLTARPFTPAPIPQPVLPRLPLVSVIIPTKYRIDLLERCLAGLVHNTGYSALEVVIVDNGVRDSRFPAVLAEARKHLDLRTVRDVGAFNFSRLVNAGVRASSGEVILLLNDDSEPTTEGWLHRMLASALEEDVGAVGACMTYPNGAIQHAGVVMGLGGACGHLWRGLGPDEAALNPYVVSPGARLAVTGACLAVRRKAFEAVGGLDEGAFPVAFNDIDFCLRLHAAGYRNVYRGDARLIHHESQSRGADDASLATRRRLSGETKHFLARWSHFLEADPHFSPAFDPGVEIGRAHLAGFAPLGDYCA
jgi:GT2 family glycosyltransferase